MGDQNHDDHSTGQPNEMTGRADDSVQVPQCATFCSCTATTGSVCLWCNPKTNDDAPEGNVVEESTDMATETGDAWDEFSRIREHPCLGRYQLQPTSAWSNMCGMFALWLSTYWQLGFGMLPLEFDFFYRSQEMWYFNQQNGVTNVDNFYDSQLAKVLHLWSRWHNQVDDELGNAQLGIILEGAELAYIIGEDKMLPVSSAADMENERDFRTVWIHNDNAVGLFKAGMNHFSGIRLLGPTEEPDYGSQEAAMIEEGGDTETEDDADVGQKPKEENSAENSSGPWGEESGTEASSGMETEEDADMGQKPEEDNSAEDSSGDESSTEKGSDKESGNESQTGQ